MELEGKDVERLFEVLEEVRALLVSAAPAPPILPKKSSWEDVWRKPLYGRKPSTATPLGRRGGSRLPNSYAMSLRAVH